MHYYSGMADMIIVGLVLAGIALCIVFMVCYDIYWCLRNWLSPLKTVHATVVRKKAKHWDALAFMEGDGITLPRTGFLERVGMWFTRSKARLGLSKVSLTEGTDCYVTFAFDSKEMIFLVPKLTYLRAETGAEGMLSFRGERFKNFVALTGGREPSGVVVLD